MHNGIQPFVKFVTAFNRITDSLELRNLH